MAKYHFAVGIARGRPEERKRVPQQGQSEELVRDEAAWALFILSISDVRFLKNLKADPVSTLWRHGFALSPQEMKLVEETFADPRYEEISGLNDKEIIERLKKTGEEEGIGRSRWWPW